MISSWNQEKTKELLLSQCQPRGSRLLWRGVIVIKVRQDLAENFARAIATSKTTSRRWSPKITVSAAVHVLAAARFAALVRGAVGREPRLEHGGRRYRTLSCHLEKACKCGM